MTDRATADKLQKFMFDAAPVRGELVEISETWKQVLERRDYPQAVKTVLGEMLAAAALLSANLKFDGVIVMQIHGDGPVRLLVVECDSNLTLRATAKVKEGVSIHDGTFFRSFVSDAEDAIAALKEGYERFDEAVAHEEPAAVPELEPAPVVRQPAGQTQVQILPVERPFDLDPGTLDVTRGRTGDEMPDEDKRMIAQQDHLANGTNVPVADPILPVTEPQPNEPVPPGVTEAAPVVGTHLGDDQAVSYEAQEVAPGVAKVYSSVEAALAAYASPATPGEHIAAAEQRAAEQQEASHGGTEESPKPV